MTVLAVGAGSQFAYHTIASAVLASRDGDIVEVQAGTYTNDFVTITDSITLEAVGGMVSIVATASPPNGKAIITEGAVGKSVTISGFALSGARVSANNGAGIRYQGGNLTLTNSYIHDNQEGLLGGAYAGGTITIDHCEFAHNGAGDGYSHNIYVGDIATFNITNSYVHDAVVGHEIKSRAETTVIENDRIADGPTGTASYDIDLPNGGNAMIGDNVIEQGPHAENPVILAYGEEGSLHAGTGVTISGNTILNDLSSSAATGIWNRSTVTLTVSGNRVYHLPRVTSGPAKVSGTAVLATEPPLDTAHPWSAAATLKSFTPGVSDLVPAVMPRTVTPGTVSAVLPAAGMSVVLFRASPLTALISDHSGGEQG